VATPNPPIGVARGQPMGVGVASGGATPLFTHRYKINS
jgi:hypothetical protein